MAGIGSAFEAYINHDPEGDEGEITVPVPTSRRQAITVIKNALDVFENNFSEDSIGAEGLAAEAQKLRAKGNRRLAKVLQDEADALADGNNRASRALVMARPAFEILKRQDSNRSTFGRWLLMAAGGAALLTADSCTHHFTERTMGEHAYEWVMADDTTVEQE